MSRVVERADSLLAFHSIMKNDTPVILRCLKDNKEYKGNAMTHGVFRVWLDGEIYEGVDGDCEIVLQQKGFEVVCSASILTALPVTGFTSVLFFGDTYSSIKDDEEKLYAQTIKCLELSSAIAKLERELDAISKV